jgi:hypothetical protein
VVRGAIFLSRPRCVSIVEDFELEAFVDLAFLEFAELGVEAIYFRGEVRLSVGRY